MSQGNNGAPAGSFGGLQYKGERTRGFAMWRSKICGVFRKQMCPGGQFWLVSLIKDRTRGFAMSRSWICDVSRRQMCPSWQFRWVFCIKERARGFAMSRSRICEVSMKQRCCLHKSCRPATLFKWVASLLCSGVSPESYALAIWAFSINKTSCKT